MGLTERAKYLRRPWNLRGQWGTGGRGDELQEGQVEAGMGEGVMGEGGCMEGPEQTEAVSATVLSHSVLADSATPWIVACQTPLLVGFSRQEYWSGLPCHLPGDHPNPGIEPRSPAQEADSLPSEPPGKSSQCFCHWGKATRSRSPRDQEITSQAKQNVTQNPWEVAAMEAGTKV